MEKEGDSRLEPTDDLKKAIFGDGSETPNFSGGSRGDCTPDIHSPAPDSLLGSESQDDEPAVNPEPPSELVERKLLDAETIGDTVFSKHWLFTTLMSLIQAVDGETQKKEEGETSEYGVDLEESVQDELCKLWDMAMNPEVVQFLQEFKAIDILTGVIAKSKAPRAVEICVGILGNMACNQDICKDMAANDKLRDLILLLLETPDAPTLVETMRLLHVCVSTSSAQGPWIASIRKEESVFPNISFILRSSTNNDLLQATAQFTDTLLYQDEILCQKWSCEDLIQSVLEAFKQIGSQNCGIFETFLHIFQLMSTCQPGVEALAAHADALKELTLKYLVALCEDEIVPLEDRQNGIGSALSVLIVLCSSWKDSMQLIIEDFQLVRCTLKLLHVLYPKYEKLCISKQGASPGEPSSDARHAQLDVDKSTGEPSSDAGHAQLDVDKSTGETAVPGKGEAQDREGSDGAGSGSGSDSSETGEASISGEAPYQRKMIQMLYDVLQSQLVEIIALISQLPEKKEGEATPRTLVYLETMCERPRLQCMLLTMQDAELNDNRDLISVLRHIVPVYELERVGRIIDDTISNGVT